MTVQKQTCSVCLFRCISYLGCKDTTKRRFNACKIADAETKIIVEILVQAKHRLSIITRDLREKKGMLNSSSSDGSMVDIEGGSSIPLDYPKLDTKVLNNDISEPVPRRLPTYPSCSM